MVAWIGHQNGILLTNNDNCNGWTLWSSILSKTYMPVLSATTHGLEK